MYKLNGKIKEAVKDFCKGPKRRKRFSRFRDEKEAAWVSGDLKTKKIIAEHSTVTETKLNQGLSKLLEWK